MHQGVDALERLGDFIQRLARSGRRQLGTASAQRRMQHRAILGRIDGGAGEHRIARRLPAAGFDVLAQGIQRRNVELLATEVQQQRADPVSQAFAAHGVLQQFTQVRACETVDVLCQEGRTLVGRHGGSCLADGNPDLTQLSASHASRLLHRNHAPP